MTTLKTRTYLITFIKVVVFLLYTFHLKALLELLGETCIKIIIIILIIIRAGTPFVSDSFNLKWKPKSIDPKIRYILDSSLSGRNYWREGYQRGLLLVVLLSLLYVFHLKALLIIELLGETRIIILIIILIIIHAGTLLVSNPVHLSWNPKYIIFWD